MNAPAVPEVPLDIPAAWIGTDMMAHPERWLYELPARHVKELERAAQHYLSLDKDIGEITAAEFPLERFGKHLEKLREKQYGLVISDWNMEPMTGYELLKQVRSDELLGKTPFIKTKRGLTG